MANRDHGPLYGRDHNVSNGRSPPKRKQSENVEPNRENHYCFYCKVQFSTLKTLDMHKESTVHKQKETLITKAVADGLQFCYTCEKIFPSKIELDAHALMSRHQPLYRVEELKNLGKGAAKEKETADAELRLAKGNKDRNEIVLRFNRFKDKDTMIKADNKYFCDFCQVDCINASNMKVHEDSWRHRAEIDRKREEGKKKFEEEAEKKFQEDDELEKNTVPKHVKTEKYFCEVCSVAMSVETAYINHLQGKKHHRQVALLRRPYKCYVCKVEYNSDKEFNEHLESRSHIGKAFRSYEDKDNSSEMSKTVEWVENVTDKHDSGRNSRETLHAQDKSRDRGKSRLEHAKSYDGEFDRREDKNDRKVGVFPGINGESEVTDLRRKLQSKKIVVTKPNYKMADPKSVDPNKRAKELEIETMFKKLEQEYYNNLPSLKQRLTKEREEDISMYQQYEVTYNKLCQEEDYVKENLRVLDEGDSRKEEYIRDMIRIQNDMREVRQELELREMMIIKRETLFRNKFPNSTETKVRLDAAKSFVIDYKHGKSESNEIKSAVKQTENRADGNHCNNSDTDLRIQLERERLLKKLGPELELINPEIREKFLAAIFDKDKLPESSPVDNQKEISATKGEKMKILTERERQLEKELAALKSQDPPKRITKSLVPQYDDVDEKKEKKRSGRSPSVSSVSSRSSSNSSDSHSLHRKKHRRSPKSRGKSKRSGADDRLRKKRRRSTSHDRKKKYTSGKKNDDKKKKDKDKEKKKPVKMTIKSHDKRSKVAKSGNPLPGDSDSNSDVVEEMPPPQQTIPVLGSSASVHTKLHTHQTLQSSQPQHTALKSSIQSQPREQFSLWKNSAIVTAFPQKESPKEDVWDIAFSTGKAKESDTLNLFNSPLESNSTLSTDILNILKSVAPILQNQQQQHLSQLRQHRPNFQPHSVQTSNASTTNISVNVYPVSVSSSATTAGNRVRSILKKMKEPPKVASNEAINFESEGSVEIKEELNHIPGLDSLTDIKPMHVQENMEGGQQNSSQNLEHHRDPEEITLYGDVGYKDSSIEKSRARIRKDIDTSWSTEVDKRIRIDDEMSISSSGSFKNRIDERKRIMQFRERSPIQSQRDPYEFRHIIPTPDPNDYYRLAPTVDGMTHYGIASKHTPSPLQERNSIERPDRKDISTKDFERDELPHMEQNWQPLHKYTGLDRDRPLDHSHIEVRSLSEIHDERPPIPLPGENEENFYNRFEKYYEMKRRKEQEDANLKPSIARLATVEDAYHSQDTRGHFSRSESLKPFPKQEERYEDQHSLVDERAVERKPHSNGIARFRQTFTGMPARERDSHIRQDYNLRTLEVRHLRADDRHPVVEDRHRAELFRNDNSYPSRRLDDGRNVAFSVRSVDRDSGMFDRGFQDDRLSGNERDRQLRQQSPTSEHGYQYY